MNVVVNSRTAGINLDLVAFLRNQFLYFSCKGIEYLEVDGKRIDAAVIPVDELKNGSTIVAYMGKDAKSFPIERV